MKTRFDADQAQSPMGEVGQPHDHAYFETLGSRIRNKLLVAYITPLIVLAVLFHYLYTKTAEQGIDNHLRSVADNQRNTVDLYLKQRVVNLQNIIHGQGQDVLTDPNAIEDLLQALKRECPYFVDLGLFGPRGTLRTYAGPHRDLVGREYSGQAWYKSLLASSRDNYVSDVFPGIRQKPHFVIAVLKRIEAESWVLRASVDPDRFGEFVGKSLLLEGAVAFLINEEGVVQAPWAAETPSEIGVPKRRPDTVVTRAGQDGADVLRAVAWLTEANWAVVVQVPASKAHRELWNARLVLSGIMLVALGLIVFFIMRFARKDAARMEAADATQRNLTDQLFSAAKMASVGEMAAGVAHEINNPLAIIYEEASMILDIMNPEFGLKLDMADLLERLTAIKDATMRGRNITRNLLAFSRQNEPDPKTIDINDLVTRTLKTRETACLVANVVIKTKLDRHIPKVTLNPNQMIQVIVNLVNNAKDAMPEGGTLTVSTGAVEEGIRIKVQDTGSGMSPEVLQRIFFPFFTTKAVGKGTGLGLSISYGIIKSFGGRIEVHSEVGQGTTFIIELPAAKPDGG